MTMALCFNCGSTKFGAFCPCQECSAGPTEGLEADVLFSDHNFSVPTLEAFGRVIKSISAVCDDATVRFESFMLYVSNNHPELLQVRYDDEKLALCSDILDQADPPEVAIEESEQAKIAREMEADGQALPTVTDEEMVAIRSMMADMQNGCREPQKKTWWKFWK